MIDILVLVVVASILISAFFVYIGFRCSQYRSALERLTREIDGTYELVKFLSENNEK